jgi:hypothetical protein
VAGHAGQPEGTSEIARPSVAHCAVKYFEPLT